MVRPRPRAGCLPAWDCSSHSSREDFLRTTISLRPRGLDASPSKRRPANTGSAGRSGYLEEGAPLEYRPRRHAAHPRARSPPPGDDFLLEALPPALLKTTALAEKGPVAFDRLPDRPDTLFLNRGG